MSDFVLTCESAADRTREFFASRNIPVVCFHYEIDDVVYTDDLYQSITPDEFFAQIAAGAMPKTSQVSVGEYEEFWEPFVAEGKDVLHLTLSSGISGTYGSACVAAQMLADRYPEGGKVRVIDSLAASSGFGLLWNMPPMCAIVGLHSTRRLPGSRSTSSTCTTGSSRPICRATCAAVAFRPRARSSARRLRFARL